jgi:hypothetical protein
MEKLSTDQGKLTVRESALFAAHFHPKGCSPNKEFLVIRNNDPVSEHLRKIAGALEFRTKFVQEWSG